MSVAREEYRANLAAAMQARDAAFFDAGEDEDARKAAVVAFDEWDVAARAKRDAASDEDAPAEDAPTEESE